MFKPLPRNKGGKEASKGRSWACVRVRARSEEGVECAIMEALWTKPETAAFWVCTFTRLYHLSPFSLPQCAPCPLSSPTATFPTSATLRPIRPGWVNFPSTAAETRSEMTEKCAPSRSKSDFLFHYLRQAFIFQRELVLVCFPVYVCPPTL